MPRLITLPSALTSIISRTVSEESVLTVTSLENCVIRSSANAGSPVARSSKNADKTPAISNRD